MLPRFSKLVLFLLLVSLQTLKAASAESGARPLSNTNVIFILADDAGYGDLSCYGATKFRTPHIDRLAAGGMRFTDAHSPSSVCTPSRYSLLTGRYGFRNYSSGVAIQSNDPLTIKPGQMTVADLFKSAGYQTAAIGKWHLGLGREGEPGFDPIAGIDFNGPIKPGPLECGFDYFFGFPMVGQLPHIFIENHHVVGIEGLADPIEFLGDERNPNDPKPWRQRYPRTRNEWFVWGNTEPIKYEHEELSARITHHAVEYIESREGDQPFFLYFAHRSPHVPWRPDPRFAGQTGFATETGKAYGEMMIELDWSVGEILDALDRNGLSENTLVIFSSDNGGALFYAQRDYAEREGHYANGPLRGQKTEVYEGGHRVPFIVRWPGVVAAGSESDALIANTDFMATVAEGLGLQLPENQAPDSYSFLSVLAGSEPRSQVRNTLVMDAFTGLLAIRQGPWKYIPAQGGGGFGWRPYEVDYAKPPAQLYHLSNDIAESKNLIAQHPEIASRLHALLQELSQDQDTPADFLPAN